MKISTRMLVIVLIVKRTTRQIPKGRVMRHLLRGTTINILDNVINSETVDTKSVGEMETRYSGSVVKLMIRPETPTPSKISFLSDRNGRGVLSMGPPKQADMAIIG